MARANLPELRFTARAAEPPARPSRISATAAGHDERLVAWCAAAVGLLAIIIRTPGAIRDAFWQDEIASAHVLIQSTPWDMVHQVARTEGTPPVWYALGWIADQIGVSPHGYRAVSVLAGGFLAAGTVIVARRLLPLWAAATAGLLVAFGWQFVDHGRELRAYELFAMITVVFAEILLREVETATPRTGWRRYALPTVVAVGALTNYFFFLSLVAAVAWIWTEPTLRDRRKGIVRQIGLGLIPFVLWSPIMVHQYLGSRFSWIGPFTARGFLDTYWELFAHNVPNAGGVLLPTLLLLAVIAGSALLARSSPTGRLVGLMALVPVVLTAIVWIGGAKVYDPRNLIAAGPFAAIALARLPLVIPKRVGVVVAAAASVLVLGAAIVAESTPPAPYNTVATYLLREGWKPNDPILLFSSFGDYFAYRGPLEWYLPHDPYLGLGEPKAHARCNALFVIAPTPANRAGVARSGLLATSQTTQGILVGRLATHTVPFSALWHSSHILVGRARPTCVRLIPEARIISVLRG